MNDDIRRMLRDEAGQGQGHARFDVDTVLVRGRRRSRQRRWAATGAAGLAAVVVVSATVALAANGPTAPERTADGANPQVADGPVAAEPSGLDEREIVRRCEPQLARLTDYQHLSSGDRPWRLHFPLASSGLTYEEGDVVLLAQPGDVGYWPVWCRIPARGDERTDVSPASLVPRANDDDGIRQACGAIVGRSYEGYAVRASQWAADNLAALLESPDGVPLGCNLRPFSYDTGDIFVVREDGSTSGPFGPESGYSDGIVLPGNRVTMDVYYVGSAAKSAYASGSGTIWRGEGVVSPRVGSIELTTETGLVVEAPVRDGAWAAAFNDPERVPDAGWPSLQARVLTGTGEVLWEGTIGGDTW